jgi:hypothetical protein
MAEVDMYYVWAETFPRKVWLNHGIPVETDPKKE